ncbi:flagellin [Asticcacaulis benevestitus]|uniref:Flagellin n=1 Tax=Asticcacaulis benevestitus DSM 16100 = ATCC BAA-896 TaxID=1121022 RepID=V4P9X1_9CAUL|nr:flagellin [Asticcacaulis benevestitus]ESQ90687.1 flagellin [Asticcacaulis benevestitus DSM 16100 = ATCC BAA-896]
MTNVSVNTNVGAMIALQNLNKTNSQMEVTQNRINTGLKVASAKDDGATFAIAQSQRASVSSLDAVKDSLSRATSSVDVAMSAGESISDMLTQMKEKALAASDTSLDTTSRVALNTDFEALRDQLTKTMQNAKFNGINLIDGSLPGLEALANADGTSRLTVAAQNLSLGGSIVTLATTASFATSSSAGALLTTIDASINNVSAALAKMGTSSKSLEAHLTFIGKLQDSITAGIGNLVDADLAKESAKLQSLQTKQQLGVQALSIANQAPQQVLSLFK